MPFTQAEIRAERERLRQQLIKAQREHDNAMNNLRMICQHPRTNIYHNLSYTCTDCGKRFYRDRY